MFDVALFPESVQVSQTCDIIQANFLETLNKADFNWAW